MASLRLLFYFTCLFCIFIVETVSFMTERKEEVIKVAVIDPGPTELDAMCICHPATQKRTRFDIEGKIEKDTTDFGKTNIFNNYVISFLRMIGIVSKVPKSPPPNTLGFKNYDDALDQMIENVYGSRYAQIEPKQGNGRVVNPSQGSTLAGTTPSPSSVTAGRRVPFEPLKPTDLTYPEICALQESLFQDEFDSLFNLMKDGVEPPLNSEKSCSFFYCMYSSFGIVDDQGRLNKLKIKLYLTTFKHFPSAIKKKYPQVGYIDDLTTFTGFAKETAEACMNVDSENSQYKCAISYEFTKCAKQHRNSGVLLKTIRTIREKVIRK